MNTPDQSRPSSAPTDMSIPTSSTFGNLTHHRSQSVCFEPDQLFDLLVEEISISPRFSEDELDQLQVDTAEACSMINRRSEFLMDSVDMNERFFVKNYLATFGNVKTYVDLVDFAKCILAQPIGKDAAFDPYFCYQYIIRYLNTILKHLIFDDHKQRDHFGFFMKSIRSHDLSSFKLKKLLVGIELNPGPIDRVSQRNFHILLMENSAYIREYINGFEYASTFFTDMHSFCDSILLSSVFRTMVYTNFGIPKDAQVLLAFCLRGNEVPTLFQRTDDGDLVGIETNPGPCNSTLRNDSKPFYESRYEPQMQLPISVGLDANSMNSIDTLVDLVSGIVKDGKVGINHTIDSGVTDSLNTLSSAILKGSSLPERFRKVIIELIAVVVFLVLSYKLGTVLSRSVMGMLSFFTDVKLPDFEVEMASDENDFVPQFGASSVTYSICAYLYCSILGSAAQSGDLKKLLSSCTSMAKAKEGLNGLVEFVFEMFQIIINFAADRFGTTRYNVCSSGNPDVDNLHEEVLKLIADFRSGTPYNYETGARLFELEKKINTLSAKIPNTRDFASAKRACFDMSSLLKPFISRMERNNIVGNGPRREPLGIMLGGPPGTGKSAATVPFLVATMASVLPDSKLKSFMDNHNDEIWNFIPENPFHDAYHGQFCTIIDEAGFMKDAAGVGDPGACGAIRFINTANAPLHMAHLEDKGNSNFSSEIVSATTNRNFFKWHSMYSSEAYTRRFKISMVVVPKIKYCFPDSLTENLWDRRLDFSKVDTSSGYDTDVPEFHPWNFLTGVVAPGPVMDFAEFVSFVVKNYEDGKQKGNRLLNFNQSIKEKYLAARMQPQNGGYTLSELSKYYSDYFGLKKDLCLKVLQESSVVDTTVSSIYTFSQKLSEVFKNLCPDTPINEYAKLAVVAGVVCGIGLIAWRYLYPKMFPQSGHLRGSKIAAKQKSVRKAIRQINAHVPQGGFDQNAINMARKVMRRNMYSVTFEKYVGNLGYATFLRGRCAMMPAHFVEFIQESIDDGSCPLNPKISFSRCSTPEVGFEVFFEDLDFMVPEGSENDIVYCNVPNIVQNHADISKFLDLEGTCSLAKFSGMFAKPDLKDICLIGTPAFYAGATSYGSYSTSDSIKYAVKTMKGDCGSLLFCIDQSVGVAKIVGLHVAGNGSTGMSAKIIPEDVKLILNSTRVEVISYIDESEDALVEMGGSFLVGKEMKQMPLPSQNQVIRSPLYGEINEPKCAPSMLRELDLGAGLRDPWKNARAKYSRYQRAINLDLLDAVTDSVSNTILHASTGEKPWDPKVFCLKQAVEGVSGIPFCEGIPRNTSSGYPFCLDVDLKGKKDWFGSDGDYEFNSEKFRRLETSIENSIGKLSKGYRMQVYYADYLKDERRKINKVVDGATRLISASPLDYLIICRMYFGDFVRSCMANRVNNEMAVGINPFSHEWTHLVKHLTSKGSNMIFGDYSAYDGSLPIAFMYATLRIIEDFYKSSPDYRQEDSRVRAGLFEDIINSHHLAMVGDKFVEYEWFGSNPSGNFLTTVMNSVCNVMIVRYCAISLSVKGGAYNDFLEATSEVCHNVSMCVFGDDNGMGISNSWSKFVNQNSLTEEMSLMGLKYTDEAKTGGEMQNFRSIEGCSFLKRGFVYDKVACRWDAPLEKDTIEEMVNWTKRRAPEGSVHQTVDMAIKEASLHGKSYFDDFVGRLKPASLRVLSYCPSTNFKENLRAVRDTENYY